MFQLVLEPILVIAGTILLSCLVGIPAAYWFTRPAAPAEPWRPHLFVYVAALVGYGELHLASFLASQAAGFGMEFVAPTVAAVLGAYAAYFWFRRRAELANTLGPERWPLLLLFVVLLVSALHVTLPVVLGRWEMAYATGDDAARWYMVVTYFQRHVFHYAGMTEETLRWPMVERPLQAESGATIKAIFHTRASFAYTASAASAVAMAVLAFNLVFEGMFGIARRWLRPVLWLVTGTFFSVFGAFTNIFYTGRTTHHFSMFAVLASFGFVAFAPRGLRRWAWFCTWCILLAYIYSIRFSVNFAMAASAILVFEWIGRRYDFRTLVTQGAGLWAAVLVAGGAAYPEIIYIVDSLREKGTAFLLLQRNPSYGADGALIDRTLKWSGFLGTFETHENLAPAWQTGLLVLVAFVAAVALVQVIRGLRSSPAYTGLIAASVVSATMLFVRQNFYVAWKLALYWPSYVLLGYLAVTCWLLAGSRRLGRVAGVILVVVILGYIAVTTRQLGYYFYMVDDRYTKVDQATTRLRDLVERDRAQHPGSTGRIFGYDLSAERHLLLREIFRHFPWQPVRGNGFNFVNDMMVESPEQLDQYRYEYLIYVPAYGSEPIDFSGNASALIGTSGPFQLYGAHSSLLEIKSGTELNMYGPWNEERHCWNYGAVLTEPSAELVFANNGNHDWLEVVVRVEAPGAGAAPTPAFELSTDQPAVVPAVTPTIHGPDFAEYRVRLTDLAAVRLTKIHLVRRPGTAKVYVTASKWGYR